MIGESICFFLRNLPAFLFVAALLLTAITRGHGGTAERRLAWVLLLPIGVTGLWAGISGRLWLRAISRRAMRACRFIWT